MPVCEVLPGDLMFTLQNLLDLVARQRRREIGASGEEKVQPHTYILLILLQFIPL